MLVLLAATGMLLNVARHEVWSVRRSVIATTTRPRRPPGPPQRRSRPLPPGQGTPASADHHPRGGHRQTPAQKAKADAERARRTQGRPRPTPRKEPR
jgi:hypothetical protein